jgi:endonuclease YncB( thermonuclease family)
VLQGHVVSITDGDTFTLLAPSKVQHKIRLHGIDAPEKGQPFGQRAKENLSRLAHSKPAKADCHKKDRYGRQVCVVWVQPLDCQTCGLTLDVGMAQLTQGLAWHYKRYEKEQSVESRARYADAEIEARARKVGLWGDPNPVPPWDWRASAKPKSNSTR